MSTVRPRAVIQGLEAAIEVEVQTWTPRVGGRSGRARVSSSALVQYQRPSTPEGQASARQTARSSFSIAPVATVMARVPRLTRQRSPQGTALVR